MDKVYILMYGEAHEGGNIQTVNSTWNKAMASARKYMETNTIQGWVWIEISPGDWEYGCDRLWIEEYDVDED
jgi:hypothetical protein